MAEKGLNAIQERTSDDTRESLPLPEPRHDVVAPDADNLLQPGELSYVGVTAGGLGRHLGLFSTTLLM